MSRSRGKHDTGRRPVVLSPEQAAEMGVSDRQDPAGSPIPGLTGNVLNPETSRQHIESPPPMDEFRGMMAHGVPHDEHTTEERAEAERGGPNDAHRPSPPRHERPRDIPPAVPVYIVEGEGGPPVIRSAYPRFITVPASTGTDPARVCGRDARRALIGLLNESQTSDIRFGHDIAALSVGNGALLPWPNNSYTWLTTQDELYAVSADSGTPKLSIVEVFEAEN